MACSLAVLLQETGKVVNAPYRISYALRASPIVCAIDTLLMLMKFLIILAVGCSPRMAVRHVWYDRFVEDEDIGDGSWVVWVWRDFAWKPNESSAAGSDSALVGAAGNDGLVDVEVGLTCSGALPGHNNEETRLADVQQPTTISASETVVPTPIATRRNDLDAIGAELGRSISLPITRSEGSATVGLPEHSTTYMQALPGSAVDRSWRLSMVSFIFGALPQAVKVFAMKGIPVTQITVAFLVVSFITAEAFRSVAGPVGLSSLPPIPVGQRARRALSSTYLTLAALTTSFVHLTGYSSMMVLLSVPGPAGSIRNGVFAYGAPLCVQVASWVSNGAVGLLERHVFPEALTAYLKSRSLRPSSYNFFHGMREKIPLLVPRLLMLGPCRAESRVPYMLVFPGFLAGIAWVYWRFTSFIHVWSWNTFSIFICPAFVITPLCVLTLAHALHYMIFASSFADHVRYVYGLQGTLDEFATGMFILVNTGLTLYGYSAAPGFDGKSTFKPGWTETLG